MIWVAFASLTAFFESLKDVWSKRSLAHTDEYLTIWALVFFTSLTLLPALWLSEPPPLGDRFGLALFASSSINVLATLLYVRALKVSDLSLVAPFVTFTPLFLLVTAPLVVGEQPTRFDILGVLLLVAGAYTLNLKERDRGYFAPLRSLLARPGPRLMLGVAFLWSFSSTFDKMGVRNSSPIFWAASLFATLTLAFTPIVLIKSRRQLLAFPSSALSLAPMGIFQGIAVFFQMQALALTAVTHVISIKRTSALFGVLWGAWIFQERGTRERGIGATIMLLGVLAIVLL